MAFLWVLKFPPKIQKHTQYPHLNEQCFSLADSARLCVTACPVMDCTKLTNNDLFHPVMISFPLEVENWDPKAENDIVSEAVLKASNVHDSHSEALDPKHMPWVFLSDVDIRCCQPQSPRSESVGRGTSRPSTVFFSLGRSLDFNMWSTVQIHGTCVHFSVYVKVWSAAHFMGRANPFRFRR